MEMRSPEGLTDVKINKYVFFSLVSYGAVSALIFLKPSQEAAQRDQGFLPNKWLPVVGILLTSVFFNAEVGLSLFFNWKYFLFRSDFVRKKRLFLALIFPMIATIGSLIPLWHINAKSCDSNDVCEYQFWDVLKSFGLCLLNFPIMLFGSQFLIFWAYGFHAHDRLRDKLSCPSRRENIVLYDSKRLVLDRIIACMHDQSALNELEACNTKADLCGQVFRTRGIIPPRRSCMYFKLIFKGVMSISLFSLSFCTSLSAYNVGKEISGSGAGLCFFFLNAFPSFGFAAQGSVAFFNNVFNQKMIFERSHSARIYWSCAVVAAFTSLLSGSPAEEITYLATKTFFKPYVSDDDAVLLANIFGYNANLASALFINLPISFLFAQSIVAFVVMRSTELSAKRKMNVLFNLKGMSVLLNLVPIEKWHLVLGDQSFSRDSLRSMGLNIDSEFLPLLEDGGGGSASFDLGAGFRFGGRR